MGKNTVEAKQWLYKRYGDSAPGKSTIIDWYVKFKRGRTNTDEGERSGRPKLAVVPGNMKNVHKIVLGDRKLKSHEIADTLRGYIPFSRSKNQKNLYCLFLKYILLTMFLQNFIEIGALEPKIRPFIVRSFMTT